MTGHVVAFVVVVLLAALPLGPLLRQKRPRSAQVPPSQTRCQQVRLHDGLDELEDGLLRFLLLRGWSS